MNKKYLILKSNTVSMQAGGLTGWFGAKKPQLWGSGTADGGWVRQSKKDDMIRDQLPKNFLDITATNSDGNPNAQRDAMDAAAEQGNAEASDKSSAIAGGIGMGLQAASIGSNFLFENAKDKNSKTDGFGNEIYDKKDANLQVGQSAVSGAIKGAQMGMTFGPWGAAIGGALGATAGLIGGKKKAKKATDAYNIGMDNNIMSRNRQNDMMNSQALLAKEGTKLGKISIPKKASKSLILRNGGKIEEPGAVNIVVKGKLHKENNNLGNKDKGIPVVNADGTKEYEVEAGEIILRQEVTQMVEQYVSKYKETSDIALFEELGKLLVPELLKNTQDNHGTFGMKIKEDANTDRK